MALGSSADELCRKRSIDNALGVVQFPSTIGVLTDADGLDPPDYFDARGWRR